MTSQLVFTVIKLYLLILTALLILVACEAKIDQNNFNKISTGMYEMEVINILGDPDNTVSTKDKFDNSSQAYWKDTNTEIMIEFQKGKVLNKRISSNH